MKKKKKSIINNLIKNKKKLNKETIFIILIITSLIISLSLFDLNMGIFGDIIKKFIFILFGFGGYFSPFFIISIGIIITFKKFNLKKNNFLISLITTFFVFLIVLDRINQPSLNFLERISYSLTLSNLGKGGGIIGGVLGFFFYNLFGTLGTYIILLVVTIANIFNVANIEIKELTYLLKSNLKKLRKRTKKKNILNQKSNIQTINKINKTKEDTDIKILNYSKNNTNKEPINLSNKIKENKILSEEEKNKKYKYPSLDLLLSPSPRKNNNEEKEVLENAKIIEDTMDNFNIDAKITQINRGPTITCYELEPAPGIKLNKIVSLSDNIALSLASSDIRIEAPIPGKAAIGIEVPNKVKDSVLFKELILSDPYIDLDSKIPLALGKSVSGESVVSSIDKMPHLLIAGATGSGKSVCINTIITSILYKSTPEDVKLMLIDPKIVELSIYNGIPHLLIPVVTDAKKATFALKWAVDEMEKRYRLFVENNARDITSFNERVDEKDKLPMIVIIIDELADLMMVAAQDIEDYICRIAQKARAAGMYLIVATQRPSVDVITGTIKANIPSRISFAVSSNIDSRTILDTGGAEKLLGKGDMLFYPSFYSKPSRLQGAFISDKEVESVVAFLKKENTSNYDKDILQEMDNYKEISLDDTDELLSDAIDLVIEEGQASISMLQRRLKIGHTRAARIVDEMESKGIVGGHEGSKARTVLVSENELNTN